MAAEGRRNGNVNNLSRMPRILNGETAPMSCNCEKLL